jgi:hypothetical protein
MKKNHESITNPDITFTYATRVVTLVFPTVCIVTLIVPGSKGSVLIIVLL